MANLSKFPSKAWNTLKKSQNKHKIELPNENTKRPKNYIRFVAIADTHNGHSKLDIPDGDVLLFGGDATLYGENEQIESFDQLLGTLPHSRKIVIGGNHDSVLIEVGNKPFQYKNGEYLQDSGTNVFGYNVYGTPWSPIHFRGAFMLQRGNDLIEKWNLIPSDTDILLTHTPPIGYGDKTKRFGRVGDIDLLLTVQSRVKPRVHVFGHIHEGKGSWSDGTTMFINCSVCDQHYKPVNGATIFDLPIIPQI